MRKGYEIGEVLGIWLVMKVIAGTATHPRARNSFSQLWSCGFSLSSPSLLPSLCLGHTEGFHRFHPSLSSDARVFFSPFRSFVTVLDPPPLSLLVNRFLPESTTTGAPISHPKCRSNWQTRLMKMTYFGDKRRARKNWWGHKILLTYIAVTTAMVGLGPRSWIGGLFNRSGNKRSGSAKFLVRPLTLLQASFLRLLFKKGGKRAEWEYPFAVAGINVSFMLIQMLDLYAAKPKCLSGMNFLRLLGENEEAFDILYCVAFAMMDAQWLAMKASYMEFNDVLKVTRTQLERELSLEDIRRIQDLPAYNLLFH